MKSGKILIAYNNDDFIGWLRYGMFWDEHPFMNMLFIMENYRGKGYGKGLVNYWEELMISDKYNLLMTSTMANEDAQHFYRKIGYREIGGFVLPNEPMELIMTKSL